MDHFLPPLASRLQTIAPFHVMELAKQAAAMERAGRDIIHMGIGEPDFTAPEPVVQAAQQALARGVTQYTPANGLPALREAIAGHYASAYGLTIDPARIVVTAGASGALLLACAALVETGSEVLMPDPSYPCNRHFVAAFNGQARLIPCDHATRFQLDAGMVREHWDPTTRGVLLASPSNPTGTSIDHEALRGIAAEVRGRSGFLIVDEIYQGLSYDAAPRSALELGDDIITINSFSKFFNMTGWRLGWLVVPPQLAGEFEKLAQNLFICASALAQHAALACFTPQSLEIYEQRRLEFRRRRDFIVPAVRQLGFEVPLVPDGAFYVYMDCRRVRHAAAGDADRLTQALLQEAGVVIVPGLDFGPHTARSHVRLSYANSLRNLHEAVERIGAAFAAA